MFYRFKAQPCFETQLHRARSVTLFTRVLALPAPQCVTLEGITGNECVNDVCVCVVCSFSRAGTFRTISHKLGRWTRSAPWPPKPEGLRDLATTGHQRHGRDHTRKPHAALASPRVTPPGHEAAQGDPTKKNTRRLEIRFSVFQQLCFSLKHFHALQAPPFLGPRSFVLTSLFQAQWSFVAHPISRLCCAAYSVRWSITCAVVDAKAAHRSPPWNGPPAYPRTAGRAPRVEGRCCRWPPKIHHMA